MPSISLRTSASHRPILILVVVAILVVPAVAVAGNAETTTRTLFRIADLANGVPANEIPTDDGWRLISAANAQFRVEALAETTETLAFDVENVDVFAFRVQVEGRGVVIFAIDGHPVIRQTSGPSIRHVAPIPEGIHTLSWTIHAVGETTSAVLSLIGREVTSLATTRLPTSLTGCVLENIPLTIRHTASLEAVEVTFDGVPMTVTTEPRRIFDGKGYTDAAIELPPLDFGPRWFAVKVVARDVLGNTFKLIDQTLLINLAIKVLAKPQGFEFDRSPTIRIGTSCAMAMFSSWSLSVDGEDVTSFTSASPYGLRFAFDGDMPYGEMHDYVFKGTLLNGVPVEAAHSFIQGLDVVEFDIGEGSLVGVSGSRVASFGSPDVPEDVPQVFTYEHARLANPFVAYLPEGAHLKALYSPDALRCQWFTSQSVCSPYGGYAPEFYAEGMHATTLTVTEPDGITREIPYFGQFAAASHYSKFSDDSPIKPPKLTKEAGRELAQYLLKFLGSRATWAASR